MVGCRKEGRTEKKGRIREGVQYNYMHYSITAEVSCWF